MFKMSKNSQKAIEDQHKVHEYREYFNFYTLICITYASFIC